LIGAPSSEAAALMAGALAELGVERAFVVHGHDGLDEVSTTGPTDVWEVADGRVEKHLWTPADFGVPRASLDALQGGDAARNAQIIRAILDGEPGPARDIAIVNAAAGLVVAELAADLKSGVAAASQAIDSQAASTRLEDLRKNFPIF
jgi:anthranilate phosphoribosyltransferase